jgi:hypothetical protein
MPHTIDITDSLRLRVCTQTPWPGRLALVAPKVMESHEHRTRTRGGSQMPTTSQLAQLPSSACPSLAGWPPLRSARRGILRKPLHTPRTHGLTVTQKPEPLVSRRLFPARTAATHTLSPSHFPDPTNAAQGSSSPPPHPATLTDAMATLTVPSSVPAVAEDCEQLHKAFEGLTHGRALSMHAHRRLTRSAFRSQVGAPTRS